MNIPGEQPGTSASDDRFGLDFTILQDIVSVLRRRKLIIAAVTVGVVLSAFAALYYLTEQYQSEARLLVILGRENTEVPLTVEKGDVFTSGVQEEEVNSYVELLKSPMVVGEAVDLVGVDKFSFPLPEPKTFIQKVKHAVKWTSRAAKKEVQNALIALDLKKRLTDREKVVKLVQGALTVEREGSSNVIRVSLRLPSQSLSQETLEQILARYFVHHIELRQSTSILEVFNTQMQDYRRLMEEAQANTIDIRNEWGISAADTQRIDLLARISALESQVDEQSSQLAARTRERQTTLAALQSVPKDLVTARTSEPNPSVLSIKQAIMEKRLDQINLTGRYKPGFPLLDTIETSIRELSDLLTTESPRREGDVVTVPHPSRLSLEQSLLDLDVTISGFATSIEAKRAQVLGLRGMLDKVDQGGDRLRLAELDLSVAEQRYLENAKRLTQAQISEQFDKMRVANVRQLSPPTTAPEPVFPKKILILGISVLGGLMLGGGLALVLEWLDDTIRSPRDLQTAGVPYLGSFAVRR
ncbi:MAG: hypothetical protein H6812_04730 [Phycisphaeraceae bacterium]|nr:hypothetical protein [Phycisphaerales bacterium]MCB9842544.1 hypothetical protein [Phycisphaeraceae bacterium]